MEGGVEGGEEREVREEQNNLSTRIYTSCGQKTR